jgi:hypothetical protein
MKDDGKLPLYGCNMFGNYHIYNTNTVWGANVRVRGVIADRVVARWRAFGWLLNYIEEHL